MENKKRKSGLAMILVVYLLGIFMGAIDTGIVTPAREIIQNGFGVDAKTGIWMITIYTLAYAASIPIMGKLADRIGRKTIYMLSIILFGLGSLLCGLSHFAGNFWFLVGARAIQAIGGGGIVPIATAEFGTSFPPEKRGMALGLVGAVYGIANIFGSLAGSAILNIFGNQNWEYIFFVNVPITIFIIIAGIFTLPNNKDDCPKKIDVLGILVVAAMVLSLLYGLKNIDFFNFSATIGSTSVYPFLIIFVVLLPVLILVEKKAADPVIQLRYFTSLRIVIALVVAFAAGFILMGIVFIPSFSENALKVPTGNGGYFTMILGFLAGVSAALSGKMIDKMGAKRVLFLGFAISIVGALFLFFVAAASPALWNVIISLALLGLGLGFTMGAPINYMMLENIPDKEASSGLATLSLIRSIGTTIAPALMVGFIAHAGMSLQDNIMAELPNEINIPSLPYVEDITKEINQLKSDPDIAQKLAGVDIPDLSSLQTVKLDFSKNDGSVTIPNDLIEKFKRSDVTTITSVTKQFASAMFDQMSPTMVAKIQGGIQSGIDGVSQGLSGLEEGMKKLQEGYDGIGQGITGMQQGLGQQQDALKMLQAYAPMLTAPLPNGMSVLDMIPENAKANIPESVKPSLAQIKSPADLQDQTKKLQDAIAALSSKIDDSKKSQADMKAALDKMAASKETMTTLQSQLKTLYDAIPGAFKTAQADYLSEIDKRSGRLETTYQTTLDGGYKSIYLIVAISSAAAAVFLGFYKSKQAKASGG
jgi:EmrB/QacA subfamily drug resistance transporter